MNLLVGQAPLTSETPIISWHCTIVQNIKKTQAGKKLSKSYKRQPAKIITQNLVYELPKRELKYSPRSAVCLYIGTHCEQCVR